MHHMLYTVWQEKKTLFSDKNNFLLQNGNSYMQSIKGTTEEKYKELKGQRSICDCDTANKLHLWCTYCEEVNGLRLSLVQNRKKKPFINTNQIGKI